MPIPALKSLSQKFLITPSPLLSRRIADQTSYLGVYHYSFATFVDWLFSHPKFPPRPLQLLSDLDRFVMGMKIQSQLPSQNYFKEALLREGILAKVFECLSELRLAGYTPESLAKCKIPNQIKLDSLTVVFSEYTNALRDYEVFDRTDMIKILISRLSAHEYDDVLKDIDIIIPLSLDLRGLERELLGLVAQTSNVIQPQANTKPYSAKTESNDGALQRFKQVLQCYLERKPLPRLDKPIATSPHFVLEATLTPADAIKNLLNWMREQGTTVDCVALCTPAYDSFAGELYRIAESLGIKVQLAHGLRIEEFAFFGRYMAAFHRLIKKTSDETAVVTLIRKCENLFESQATDHQAYSVFRRKVLGFLRVAKKHALAHAGIFTSQRFRQEFIGFARSLRISNKELGNTATGLFLGMPEDLQMVEVDYLAILGLQDHHYPMKQLPDPILNDEERACLNQNLQGNIAAIALSDPPDCARDLLEKISLGVRKGIYLHYLSHDLDSGALSVPSAFFNRALIALGHELKVESLYRASRLPDSFIPRDKQNPFDEYDESLAQRNETSTNFLKWKAVVSDRLAPHTNHHDGPKSLSYVETPQIDLSPSSMSVFFKCPYQFYLKKIAAVPAIQRLDDGEICWLDAMSRGTFLHKVYEVITSGFLAKGTPSLKSWKRYLDSVETQIPTIVAGVEDQAQFTLAKEGVPSQVIHQERQELLKTAEMFVTRENTLLDETGYFPIAAEVEFKDLGYEFSSNGKKFFLNFHGQVDRLDSHESGKFRVLDYKTGGNKFKQDTDHLFLDKNENPYFQHVIYGLWAIRQSGYNIKPQKLEAGYYFCTDQGGWEIVAAPFRDFMPLFDGACQLAIESILTGEFRKNPKHCDMCDYRLVCRGTQNLRQKVSTIPEQIEALSLCLLPKEG